MIRRARTATALAVMLAAGSAAWADIVFKNVVIEGSLVGENTSFETGPNDIKFTFDFPDGTVGDPVDPRRSGDVSITFEALSDDGIDADELTIGMEGSLFGSGRIVVNEIVEDVANPGVIATYQTTLTADSEMPHVKLIGFERASTHIKVKKTFFLDAPDTQERDLAQLGMVRQNFTPEPASLALLALYGLAWLRRR